MRIAFNKWVMTLGITLMIIPIFAYSQQTDNSFNNKVITKWEKAVVGLEMRKFDYEDLDSQKNQKTLKEALKIQAQTIGSAIFLKKDSKRYLITARHLLYDQAAVQQKLKYADTADIKYTIYENIFKITLENEMGDSSNEGVLASLSLLGAGPYSKCRYVFSEPDIDLAIISLDGGCWHSMFADYLERKGYEPININDIDTSKLSNGLDIIALGFPVFALEGFRKPDENAAPFVPSLIYNMVTTFGKIGVPSMQSKYFLGDITIAPGNSGGPVINHNKLIGIVIQQPVYPLETNQGQAIFDTKVRMPYAVCIKSFYILTLLNEMIIKDKNVGVGRCK